MKIAHFLLIFYLLFCCCFATEAQTVKTPAPQNQNGAATVEREIKEFFDSYADDLQQHRRESIANRYNPCGYFRMGNGRKTLVSFDDIKNRYLTSWIGTKSFEWKNISIQVLSPAAAGVGLFDRERDTGAKSTIS